MNLIIDIGNTCAKLVCFDGDEVIEEQRVDKGEYGLLDKFCKKYTFERGIYSTVVDIPQDFEKKIKGLPVPMLEFLSGITPVPIKASLRGSRGRDATVRQHHDHGYPQRGDPWREIRD